MSATGSTPGSGFTLLEMLVVLAILGLIGGLIYPAIAAGLRAQQFRTGLAAAHSALRVARARAIRSGGVIIVAASADGTTLVSNGYADRLPESIRAATSPASGIRFFGDGSSSGGALALTGAGRGGRISVRPATGMIADDS